MRRVRLSAIAAVVVSAVAAVSVMMSCNTSGCTDNRSSILLAGFYSAATDKAVMLDSVEIGGVGAPNDSLLVTVSDRVEGLYMPFRAEYGSTSFYIHYANKALDPYPELNDTLTFHYISEPYFASEECGAMYRYRVTSMTCTSHLIDSVALIDPFITNADVERLKVYFRTGSNDDD